MPETKKSIKSIKSYQLNVEENGAYPTRRAYAVNPSHKSTAKWHIPVSKQVILRLIKWLESL